MIYNGSILYTIPPQTTTLWQPPTKLHPWFSIISSNIKAISPVDYSDVGVFGPVIISNQTTKCAPVRVRYVVRTIYENNIRMVTNSFTPVQRYPLGLLPASFNIPLANNSTSQSLSEASLPASKIVEWYSDINLLNVLNAALNSLSGTFLTSDYTNWTIANTKIPGYGDTLWSLNNTWIDLASRSRPLITDSKFNKYLNFSPDPQDSSLPIAFTMTQDLLNEFLFNVTLSIITNYGYWNTTVNVTTTTFINLYSFSSPTSLILPYFLGLAVALPFVALGLWALHSNGVPASDGGFIQLIMMMKSAKLESEASAGCLGGGHNIPEKLRNLEIIFGELIEKDNYQGEVVRRAGFGTEEEITPLRKGVKYGKAVRRV